MMNDKILWCKECYRTFVFPVGEQKFFAEKGFDNPVRCPSCRTAKKERSDEGCGGCSYSMRRNSRPGRGYFRKLGGW